LKNIEANFAAKRSAMTFLFSSSHYQMAAVHACEVRARAGIIAVPI